MGFTNFRTVAFAALIAASTATQVAAQETSESRVAAGEDWAVFVESDPQECWAVSAPKESVNTRDGNVVAVRRSEILLFVFNKPGSGVSGQVAFTGGYPFAGGSTVSLEIGGTEYQLFTEEEWAWPASPEEDARIIEAMKRGADATIVGRSGRGTRTEDLFSLRGFTAAFEEAGRRCQ